MKLALKKFKINAPFPTTQCGHMTQTFLVDEFKDDLFGRIASISDNEQVYIHIVFDLLGLKETFQNRIKDHLSKTMKTPFTLVVSSTHTHYAHDNQNKEFLDYLYDITIKEIDALEYHEYDQLYVRYYQELFNKVGRSRISGYESNLERLGVTEIALDSQGEKVLLNLVVHNVHPTILSADVKFFSSEFPGRALRELEKKHPEQFFIYCTGAAGDISTRFTRDDQTYDSVRKLGDVLAEEIEQIKTRKEGFVPLKFSVKSVEVPYEHEIKDIDISRLRDGLSERELITVNYGKIIREKMKGKEDTLEKHALITAVKLSGLTLIYFPNELFSDYLNNVDLSRTMVITYSNGYAPYILPIGFKYITYEMFLDTLSDKTKVAIAETLQMIDKGEIWKTEKQ